MSLFGTTAIYAAASSIAVFLAVFSKLAAISLFGSHAFLLPDDANQSSSSRASGSDDPLKKSSKKKNSKDKFVWNEGGSEILRITIGDSYLEQTRYYPEYDQAVLYSVLPISLLIAREYLSIQSSSSCSGSKEAADSRSRGEDFIPVIVATFCLIKLLLILRKVSWDKRSSRNSEWLLSWIVGLVGFVIASIVIFAAPSEIIDFRIEQAVARAGTSKFPVLGSFPAIGLALAIVAAWISGLLLGPALKSVRSFWIGTNQLGWEIAVVKITARSRFLLNFGIVFPIATTFLWLKPMAELFIKDPSSPSTISFGWRSRPNPFEGGGDWARGFGFAAETFEEVKFVAVIVTGLIQLLLLRINVQAYLNLGVLAWYESLHGSKTPDTAALKNKILVVNHFVCRVAIQNLVPAALLMIFAALARSPPCSSDGFVAQIALFFAWWTLFSWSLLSSTVLALFRFGLLLAY